MENDTQRELENKLKKERDLWTTKIGSLIKMINRPDALSEAQVLMLSYRHNLVEKLIEFKSLIGKQKTNDYKFRQTRYRYYKVDYDLKMNQSEINSFIDADLGSRINKINELENHLLFYQQCIETLDKLGFAIKNRIQISQTYL